MSREEELLNLRHRRVLAEVDVEDIDRVLYRPRADKEQKTLGGEA